MNRIRVAYFLIVLCCSPAWVVAEEVPLKKVVQRKVEEINNSLIKGDFAKVADLTHSEIVQLAGGREKMISVLEAGIKEMKTKGFTFQGVKVEEALDPVVAGDELFVVVPFVLEMKVPGGIVRQKTFVIGVSSDQGKSWGFVNGDLDIKRVKRVIPTLPEQLKLPEKQQPVFEKD